MAEESTSIVILGATGDLARRKLLPALFQLACKERLPRGLRIVGFSRPEYTDEAYRELMWEGMQEFTDLAVRKDRWAKFSRGLSYLGGDFGAPKDFTRLRQRLEQMEGTGGKANRLFYLSIAPQFFGPAVKNMGVSGLATEDTGWRRVVIEKPFGRDLESARALNHDIHAVFDERQVYRIDHYLGKETVQNLLVFRFANGIFEQLWNRNCVDNVQITAAEKVSVGDRAGYYDQSGVVRDMLQNHLLQLLTMVAMEPPVSLDADSLRNRKVEVLQSIRRWTPEEATRDTVLGQYDGYLGEADVAADSATATYAALRLHVDNRRWQGVPFYLRTGKAMVDKVTEIVIEFRRPPHLMFPMNPGEDLTPNILSLCLQPDEGLHLKFEVKVPGQGMTMRSRDLEFHYESAFRDQAIPEAYERLLQDALEGDPSLFIRSDHIEEGWRIVDPLLQGTENGAQRPQMYEPGSWGPEAADSLLTEDGRTWHRVCGVHEDVDA